MTSDVSTKTLWTSTHSALVAGEWSTARRLLETLARRQDNADMLPSAINYGAPVAMRDLLQARIDACNAVADRRLSERLDSLKAVEQAERDAEFEAMLDSMYGEQAALDVESSYPMLVEPAATEPSEPEVIDTDALDNFTRAYLGCALWSSVGDDGEPLDASCEVSDIHPETVRDAIGECRDFQQANADDLAGLDPEQCGHDFWLTRNGHGAGFWDRGLGERGERLTAACKAYGSADLYIGDDGVVYGA